MDLIKKYNDSYANEDLADQQDRNLYPKLPRVLVANVKKSNEVPVDLQDNIRQRLVRLSDILNSREPDPTEEPGFISSQTKAGNTLMYESHNIGEVEFFIIPIKDIRKIIIMQVNTNNIWRKFNSIKIWRNS